MDAGKIIGFNQDALANPKLPLSILEVNPQSHKGEPQAPEIHRIPRSERHPYLFGQTDEG